MNCSFFLVSSFPKLVTFDFGCIQFSLLYTTARHRSQWMTILQFRSESWVHGDRGLVLGKYKVEKIMQKQINGQRRGNDERITSIWGEGPWTGHYFSAFYISKAQQLIVNSQFWGSRMISALAEWEATEHKMVCRWIVSVWQMPVVWGLAIIVVLQMWVSH